MPQAVGATAGVGLNIGRLMDIAYLDIYARGPEEAQILENAVAFMDDKRFPTYGNAVEPYYRFASKTETIEDEGVEHITILYEVRYGDARKLPSI